MRWSSSMLKIWIFPPKSYTVPLCVASFTWFVGLQSSEPSYLVLMSLTKITLTIHYFDSKTNILDCRNLSICGCLSYFLPGRGLLCFPSLNFTRFLLACFSSPSQSLSVAAGPVMHTVQLHNQASFAPSLQKIVQHWHSSWNFWILFHPSCRDWKMVTG